MDAIAYLLSECERLGVTPSQLYKAAPKQDLKNWPEHERKKLRDLKAKGLGNIRIAKAMGKSLSAVKRAIKREKKRPKYTWDREVTKAPVLSDKMAALMSAGLKRGERHDKPIW